ncbi:hypothetical protein AG4045_010536, partial [Apium graveolens]
CKLNTNSRTQTPSHIQRFSTIDFCKSLVEAETDDCGFVSWSQLVAVKRLP